MSIVVIIDRVTIRKVAVIDHRDITVAVWLQIV